jgi:predicted DCC family thiol-disulfide oxidoreductase YuxK
MENPDVLYFDGSCPMCQREMAHLANMKSEQLVLQDIHALESENDVPPKEALLKSLHLRRGDNWVVGIEANIAAWQYTRIGILWRWLRWPLIKPIASWCYTIWAAKRYERRYDTADNR